MKKNLFTASWVLLLVMSIAVAAASIGSLGLAYFGKQDNLTEQVSLEKIRETGGEHGEEAVKAYRGRRATAATWALGWALMTIFVVISPYRAGQRWAWWAVMISIVASQSLSLARVPLLSMKLGANPSAIILVITLLALLAGAPRLFSREAES